LTYSLELIATIHICLNILCLQLFLKSPYIVSSIWANFSGSCSDSYIVPEKIKFNQILCVPFCLSHLIKRIMFFFLIINILKMLLNNSYNVLNHFFIWTKHIHAIMIIIGHKHIDEIKFIIILKFSWKFLEIIELHKV